MPFPHLQNYDSLHRYTRREDILNGGIKQCLTLYEQDMNEEAYHNRYGTDLWIRSDLRSKTSDEKRECMGYDIYQPSPSVLTR